uniref:Membrane spanning protein n=1 Tax=Ascaris lumbricoides TaxID=6252 RepID=A0A0M3HZA7_ASCLU
MSIKRLDWCAVSVAAATLIFKSTLQMASQHSTYEVYPRIAHNMRAAQLIAVIIQITILYSESERLGMSFLFPTILHAINLYHIGYRWYYCIDGRHDFKQLLSLNDFNYKLPYIFDVFGGILLALVAHVMLYIPGLYRICSYVSIACAGVTIAVELLEAILSKLI